MAVWAWSLITTTAKVFIATGFRPLSTCLHPKAFLSTVKAPRLSCLMNIKLLRVLFSNQTEQQYMHQEILHLFCTVGKRIIFIKIYMLSDPRRHLILKEIQQPILFIHMHELVLF